MAGDLMTRLADAALAWDVARREANRIRDERNPIDCERQNFQEFANERPGDQFAPCWKLWKQDRTGEGFDRDDIVNWCASCQRRQALSDQLRKANAVRGARLRHMRQIAARIHAAHEELLKAAS